MSQTHDMHIRRNKILNRFRGQFEFDNKKKSILEFNNKKNNTLLIKPKRIDIFLQINYE